MLETTESFAPLDMSNLLNIDITRKQQEQLKQMMKQLKRLDYTDLPRNTRSDFEKYFINELKSIHDSIEVKRANKRVINMQDAFVKIVGIIETHIKFVNEAKTISNDFKSYTPQSTKKKNINDILESKNTF